MLLDVALAPSARFVVGGNPVPDNDTRIGVAVALLAMARLPLNTPAAVGANFTDMVHEAPPARMLPQLLVCVKPVVVVIEPIESAAAPVGLLRVTFCAAEVWPTSRNPKMRLAGLTLGGLLVVFPPVLPTSMTVTVLPALLGMVSVPGVIPEPLPSKLTSTMHQPFSGAPPYVAATSELPQGELGSAETEKPALAEIGPIVVA